MKEEVELKEMKRFRPGHRHPTHKASNDDRVSIVQRSQQWARKKEERLQKRKIEVEIAQKENCSFKPMINKQPQNEDEGKDSSHFVQDGIQSYLQRLEHARKLKKEKQDRLSKKSLPILYLFQAIFTHSWR